jgi:hypothetical protein
MHMFFRIFDKLFELLLGNIQILDKIFNVNEKTFCVSKYKALQKLEKFITEECKIKNVKFFFIKEVLKCKSFNEVEMKKIFKKVIF